MADFLTRLIQQWRGTDEERYQSVDGHGELGLYNKHNARAIKQTSFAPLDLAHVTGRAWRKVALFALLSFAGVIVVSKAVHSPQSVR